MPLALLLTSEVLDAHYDKAHAWLYLDWKGPQEIALVQAACEQVLALVRQTGAQKVLNDNTHITQTSWELVKWVAYDYLPRTGDAGVEYVAWVQSPAPSCRSHVDLMDDFIGQKPQVAIFSEVAGAYAWLESMNTAAHLQPDGGRCAARPVTYLPRPVSLRSRPTPGSC